MAFNYTYQLTEKANADLDEIISYIAIELANPKAASDFLDRLMETIEEIRTFPKSGSLVVNEFLPKRSVRKKIIGNYIMYYLPVAPESTIYILRIIYGKRNRDEIWRHS